MTAQQKTRVSIDVLLVQASWHVCNVPNANVDASNGVVTARIRPIKAIRSRFIAIALMCDDVMRWAIRRGKTTTGQTYWTLEFCRALPTPVPPTAEQILIVAEVDHHLSIIREVEAEVDTNLKRSQVFRQVKLQKRFRASSQYYSPVSN